MAYPVSCPKCGARRPPHAAGCSETLRPEARIDVLLSALGMLWKRYPDLRFGQLVAMIEPDTERSDAFYVEDDEWLARAAAALHRSLNLPEKKP